MVASSCAYTQFHTKVGYKSRVLSQLFCSDCSKLQVFVTDQTLDALSNADQVLREGAAISLHLYCTLARVAYYPSFPHIAISTSLVKSVNLSANSDRVVHNLSRRLLKNSGYCVRNARHLFTLDRPLKNSELLESVHVDNPNSCKQLFLDVF